MLGYHLIAKGYSIQLGVWGCYNPPPPPAGPGQCPGGGSNFLKNVLNIGLKKMFEKLKTDTFQA